jgi:hypothetical protein
LTIKKLGKNRRLHDQLLLLAAILAWWWQPVASVKALNHIYWVMCMVLYRRTATAIKMASKINLFCLGAPLVCHVAFSAHISLKIGPIRMILSEKVFIGIFEMCFYT